MKKKLLCCLPATCLLVVTTTVVVAQSTSDSIQENSKQAVMDRIDNQAAVGTVVAFLENGKHTHKW